MDLGSLQEYHLHMPQVQAALFVSQWCHVAIPVIQWGRPHNADAKEQPGFTGPESNNIFINAPPRLHSYFPITISSEENFRRSFFPSEKPHRGPVTGLNE